MNNVILLCGGIGRRMAPIPNCNKSLLPIEGEVNLHRILRILNTKGLSEVVIATNPISAPDIDNFLYNSSKEFHNMNIRYIIVKDYTPGCNNVVTLRAVSEYLGNSYIMETDQCYLENKLGFLRAEPFDHSVVYTTNRTEEDWGVHINREGKVLSIMKENPGKEFPCLSGITYLCKKDSSILCEYLEGTKDNSIYWEELLNPKSMNLFNEFCSRYSFEYDTIKDLVDQLLMNPQDIANLIDENHEAKVLDSMTNTSYLIHHSGELSVLRIPGRGTDKFINRRREMSIESSVPTSLHPESFYYGDGSVKITKYLSGYSVLSKLEDIPVVLRSLSKIHEPFGDSDEGWMKIDLVEELSAYEGVFLSRIYAYREYFVRRTSIRVFLHNWFKSNPYLKSHRDLVPLNILINEEKDVKLIDWEYAGFLSDYWDYASLACEFSDQYQLPLDTVVNIILDTLDLNEEDLYCWVAVVDFIWASWSLAKEVLGDDVSKYGKRRYERSCRLMDLYFKEI